METQNSLLSEEERNKLTNLAFLTAYRFEDVWGTMDIWKLRKHHPTINNYLLDMIETISNEISLPIKEMLKMYFIFDNEAKEYLKFNADARKYLLKYWIDFTEKERLTTTVTIEDVLKVNDNELVETIWDIFYDNLAKFLQVLWSQTKEGKIWTQLQEASLHIQQAWEICKRYTDKNLDSEKHDKAEKRINTMGWVQMIAEKIWNTDNAIMKQFLLNLSNKIRKDWKKDFDKGRQKLAHELYICADMLQECMKNLY